VRRHVRGKRWADTIAIRLHQATHDHLVGYITAAWCMSPSSPMRCCAAFTCTGSARPRCSTPAREAQRSAATSSAPAWTPGSRDAPRCRAYAGVRCRGGCGGSWGTSGPAGSSVAAGRRLTRRRIHCAAIRSCWASSATFGSGSWVAISLSHHAATLALYVGSSRCTTSARPTKKS